MRFGDVPVDEALGAILAHSVRLSGSVLKKGRRLTAADLDRLRSEGLTSVVAARLDSGDVHEDAAADRLARAIAGDQVTIAAPFTGRVNLFAAHAGIALVDRARIDAVNAVDEALTVASVAPWTLVEPRQMVATIKIIPFAVPEALLEAAVAEAEAGRAALSVAPFRARRIGLIQTRLAATKPSVLDKTAAITHGRVSGLGAAWTGERRCDHAAPPLASEIRATLADGADIVLVVGASAITDRRDVIPAAIEAAGGRIEHLGMPVDPGNLLLLGAVGDVPVLGLPGCARSPKLNGVDWVLERLVAGLPVGRPDIMAMGVGGLLADMPGRPQPRAVTPLPRAPRVAAIVLAAGQSRRMGATNKMLVPVDGKPMVVHTVEAALASHAAPVIAVVGHDRDPVAAALSHLPVTLVDNPDHAQGLSTSLRAGLNAVPEDADAVLVCLGDMPLVTGRHLDRLIAAYAPVEGRAIVVPTDRGKRGNPVLWDRRFFDEMRRVAGDVGARHLIGVHDDLVVEVPFDDGATALDVDTPAALADLIAGGGKSA